MQMSRLQGYLCSVCCLDNNWISLEWKCFCLRIKPTTQLGFQILLGKCLTALDMQSQEATKDIERFGSFAELCAMKFQIFHIILHLFHFLLLHSAFNHTCCTCLSVCLSVSFFLVCVFSWKSCLLSIELFEHTKTPFKSNIMHKQHDNIWHFNIAILETFG